MKETSYNKKRIRLIVGVRRNPLLGSSEINYVEIRCFYFYLKNSVYKSINIIVNRRSMMINRDFSLLVTIPPPFYIEGKTSDIFITYPI